MCGIAGTVNWGGREVLQKMTAVQAHRGPDDSGLWEHISPDGTHIGLGSRRLAIIDLSSEGHMPMPNEDGSVWITYNGEIYNFHELRQELIAKGHTFRSKTDTEVILHLYEEEGFDCVKRLNGMFAFAICDLRKARPLLFVARDHFGVKPLYYIQRGRQFAFASEVKALLNLPGFSAEMDLSALPKYLNFLWVPDPQTMFREIFKLPAGYWGVFCDGRFEINEYWDLSLPAKGTAYALSEEELKEEIRERLRQSVKSQMISDVPLGAFLSAGLDSSSIVSLMSQSSRKPVHTYTITFPAKHRIGETTLDDASVASRMAIQFGCTHQEIMVSPEITSLLPKLIWHMDEPVADPAIITAYLVCQEARKSATVLLSGIGGDEVFGGYRKYYAHKWASAYHHIPLTLRQTLNSAMLHFPAMRGTPLKGVVRLAKKMARSASLPPQAAFLTNCTYLDHAQMLDLCVPDLKKSIQKADPWERHKERFEDASEADFLNQMLYLDTKTFMSSLNLTYNDKMSMASSVEVRVPFLDRDLAEFVMWNVPPELKIKGFLRPTTKYILREAMKERLPAEVLRQPKAGFGAPVDYWLANELRDMVDELLSPGALKSRGYFRPEAVQTLIEQQRSNREDWSMQIWQLLTLELWHQAFLDRSSQCAAGPGGLQSPTAIGVS